MQEALFRYQFRHNESVQQQRAPVYFLAFGDPHDKAAADPPSAFLARFAGSKPRVAKYSDAHRPDGGWVIDKKTNESGIIFFVHDVRLNGPDMAVAKGGYQEDKRSASGNSYRLKFRGGRWQVLETRMDWISRERPNKSLEPTPTAVTPRAIEMKAEAKKAICDSSAARVAPAVVVAHL